MHSRLTILTLWLLLIATAHAQPTAVVKLKPGSLDVLVPVPAHQARCVALHETLGLLAFGHEHTYPDAHVSLVKLDAKGQPAPYSTPLKLPCPEVLTKKHANYPVALAFHPKLPLLYVWQDVNFPHNISVPVKPPEVAAFDHLVIFDVSKEVPRLVVSLCRGEQYIYGMQHGGLACDPDGGYLFVPNVRDAKNLSIWHLARFPLDADGLPKVLPKELPLVERLKELAKLNDAGAVVPTERTPVDYVSTFPINHAGSVTSVTALSKDIVLAGGASGVFSWRPGEKTAPLNHLPLPRHSATLLTVHPRLPVTCVTKVGTNTLLRVEQHEGYFTLLPRQYQLPDAVLSSHPAFLPGRKLVAVGGQYQVYLLPLDEEGRPGLEATVTTVLAPAVKTLLYSEKHDRLYVGVDLSK